MRFEGETTSLTSSKEITQQLLYEADRRKKNEEDRFWNWTVGSDFISMLIESEWKRNNNAIIFRQRRDTYLKKEVRVQLMQMKQRAKQPIKRSMNCVLCQKLFPS